MTTITIDSPLHISSTHFRDADDLLKALLMSEFEAHLDDQYKKAKIAQKEDFVNL